MGKKYQTNKDWETPRLIARLEENSRGILNNAWNPAVNPNKKSSAMDKLGSVVAFAYMGNSEFEFGTTRDAANNLQAYIDRNKIAPLMVSVSALLKAPVPIYVLAPRKFHGHVENFLNQSDYWRTAEPTYFRETLGGIESRHDRTVGWFDLHNQVLFFKDKDTFEAVRKALGVKTALPANAPAANGGKLELLMA